MAKLGFSRQQSGFTLIELMITVVIIGILAAIAFPNYTRIVNQNKIKNAQSDLASLSLALENIYQRKLSYGAARGDGAVTDGSVDSVTTYVAIGTATELSTWQSSTEFFDFNIFKESSAFQIQAVGKASTPLAGCKLTLNNSGDKASVCTNFVAQGWL